MENMAGFWWMVLLFIVFLGIILYVFRAGASKRYRADAEIPFEDEANSKPDRTRR
ncbi:cbb3-type cytochrome c oxidase subunit 3 [Thermithiobacillus plumbiphilus]|uniref:Cbb3-type cytochrome c oxidase subunit 3 n=1 Tax=Thermithiobacillus plumbiphilus TaxID=1729899 RepID=A0ABU9D5K2_9PROT